MNNIHLFVFNGRHEDRRPRSTRQPGINRHVFARVNVNSVNYTTALRMLVNMHLIDTNSNNIVHKITNSIALHETVSA